MAYCRFSDGDVYLYEDASGDGLSCCGCYLGEFSLLSREDALRHLGEHAAAGHEFPFEVAAELLAEIADAVPAAVAEEQRKRRAAADARAAEVFATMEDYQRCGACGHEDFDPVALACPQCGSSECLMGYARFPKSEALDPPPGQG